jgi:hypothetical protein
MEKGQARGYLDPSPEVLLLRLRTEELSACVTYLWQITMC